MPMISTRFHLSGSKANFAQVAIFLTIYSFAFIACKPNASDRPDIRYVVPKDGLNMRYVVPKDGLNMREEPSPTGRRILTIPKGAQVMKLEEKPESLKIDTIEGRWTKVSWEGKTGWVFGGFLDIHRPVTDPKGTEAEPRVDKESCMRECQEKNMIPPTECLCFKPGSCTESFMAKCTEDQHKRTEACRAGC